MWENAGTGGRRGSLWAIGSMGLLVATAGAQAPAGESAWECAPHRGCVQTLVQVLADMLTD